MFHKRNTAKEAAKLPETAAQAAVDRVMAEAMEQAAISAEKLAGFKGMENMTGPEALKFYADTMRQNTRACYPHLFTEGPDNGKPLN